MFRRVLLIVLILFAIWRIVTAWGRKLDRSEPGADSFSRFSAKAKERRRRQEPEPEELVACDGCGTYVPMARALATGSDQHFCSESCRQASENAVGDR
jgi:hypothetical protein